MRTYRLNSRLDARALAARFAESGRLQIEDFLELPDARDLAEETAGLDWRLVLNNGARHIDLSRGHLQQLGQANVNTIIAESERAAAQGFQYLYENYPVTDLEAAGELTNKGLMAIYAAMNAAPILDAIRTITGAAIDFCDMQATRYGPGHFLTVHHDEVEGKNRKLAYVLGLTDNWSPTWGGQLQFLDRKHQSVTRAFVPKFNALSIFSVPAPHHVSQVATFAPASRVSLTGWFRSRS